jgi:hypothetical protein
MHDQDSISTDRGNEARSDLELRSFRTWLTVARMLNERTADQYTNLVRAFFRDHERANALINDPPRFAEEVFAYDTGLPRGTRPVFRAAMRAFTVYAKNSGKTLKASFEDGRGSRWKERAEALRLVRAPLGKILRDMEKRHVDLRRLPFIRWRDVTGGPDGRIEDRDMDQRFYASLPVLIELRKWAGGAMTPSPDQPLVPTEPCGMKPMPYEQIRDLARGV